MLHTIPKSPEAFAKSYQGKTLGIQVSGAEMEAETRATLHKTIDEFTRDGIRVILVSDAEALAHEMNDELNGVIVLTNSRGVLNKEGNVIPVVFGDQLHDEGAYKKHEITGDMRKICEEVQGVLPSVHKAVVTNVAGLRDEIFNVFGSGTLFAHRESLQLSPVLHGSPEEDIFEDIYIAMRSGKNPPWKLRSHVEMDVIRRNHLFLSVKNSPLGGMSLTDEPNGPTQLEALWAGYLGGGVSRELVQRAQQTRSSLVTRTRSEALMHVLEQAGFRNNGVPAGQQSTEWTWQQT